MPRMMRMIQMIRMIWTVWAIWSPSSTSTNTRSPARVLQRARSSDPSKAQPITRKDPSFPYPLIHFSPLSYDLLTQLSSID